MKKIPLKKIKDAVCKVFDTTPEKLHERTKEQPHALARQFCYYYARRGRSYVSVAKEFNRCHGSVLHGVRKIHLLKDADWEIKSYVSAIEEEL